MFYKRYSLRKCITKMEYYEYFCITKMVQKLFSMDYLLRKVAEKCITKMMQKQDICITKMMRLVAEISCRKYFTKMMHYGHICIIKMVQKLFFIVIR